MGGDYAYVRAVRKLMRTRLTKTDADVRTRARYAVRGATTELRTDGHMTTPRPPQPPAMQLIEQRRERLGMSKRTAAALAGISDARYRQLEKGGREIRGIWISEDATDPVLARMALAVRLTPDDIRPFSERAAQMIADLIAERNASGQKDADDAARMVDALDGGRSLPGRKRAALEAKVAEALRDLRDG